MCLESKGKKEKENPRVNTRTFCPALQFKKYFPYILNFWFSQK
jgi:hypothetical protein